MLGLVNQTKPNQTEPNQTKMIKILPYAVYCQRLSAVMSESAKAASWMVYCQTLRESGECEMDTVECEVLPTGVSWSIHQNARVDGYCYLYMFRDTESLTARRLLKANPTLRDIFSMTSGCFSTVAVKDLRISRGADGVYHVGVEGTWSLSAALGYYVKQYGKSTRVHKSLTSMPFVDAGLVPDSVIGHSEQTAVNFTSVDSMFTAPGIIDLKHGDGCLVVNDNEDVICTGVFVDDKTVTSTMSLENEHEFPRVLVTSKSGETIMLVTHAVCSVCGDYGLVEEHLAGCHLRAADVVSACDMYSGMDKFGTDITSVGCDDLDAVIDVKQFVSDYYMWWTACGYPSLSVFDCSFNHVMTMYYGAFRQGFLLAFKKKMKLRCDARFAFLSTLLPVEYKKFVGLRDNQIPQVLISVYHGIIENYQVDNTVVVTADCVIDIQKLIGESLGIFGTYEWRLGLISMLHRVRFFLLL